MYTLTSFVISFIFHYWNIKQTEGNYQDKIYQMIIEKNNVNTMNDDDFIMYILTTNYKLHFIMIYFIVMLFYLFTLKIIIDKNIKLDFLKNLPLGTYIFSICNKMILIWKNSLYFWIYFLILNLFIFISTSTFTLYGCIFILKNP